MSNDIFICGECQTIFEDLNQFVVHKKDGCQGLSGQVEKVAEGEESEAPSQIYIIQVTLKEILFH